MRRAWSELLPQLQALAAEKKSAAEIARTIGQGLTKNAVAGACYRYGVPLLCDPVRARQLYAARWGTQPKAAPAPKPLKPTRSAAASAVTAAAPKRPVGPHVALPPALPRTAPTVGVMKGGCRWPLWGNWKDAKKDGPVPMPPPFCDAPRVEGRPYCAACCDLAYPFWRARAA
ncbi:GcrA family cell cycle regulator [Paracraurococcus ruber]|uniref:GcrA cell cycle regulator n=1 Tax=Paracraurococcus ruber TaxID=77675 RepID=A0ABS1CQZ6_9PROT|nr:GcrA family cell cycle regulator [Paracraurococcus ruber]MBK1656864.1 hypothetical protein [Paracraurococcus ruber]TDG33978.1 hypothetical protein E2C05_01685 [Paracraurococcus ruber]